MRLILKAHEIGNSDLSRVGGKALSLTTLSRAGFLIPEFICLSTDSYRAFVDGTGLRERILLELHRKDFAHMRWEEIWDCATRIRNLFLRKSMPADLSAALHSAILKSFADRPVVVRSSAPEEDAARASFAGLHASYVNIHGAEAILESIRMVWASLWSDAALLYRQETGLDAGLSAMAVVVQELVCGRCSGIAFSQSPIQPSQALVESVYGLNQGLVDGDIEPDRWVIDREKQKVIGHTPAARAHHMAPGKSGTELQLLSADKASNPPLPPEGVMDVFKLAMKAEAHFGVPQDVEWTIRGDQLYLLQSRPVTTQAQPAAGDQRAWYLSLHRSFQNLLQLRHKIENEHIPAMIRVAQELSRIDPGRLSDRDLAAEIQRRWQINNHWVAVYWDDFIPFAHGIRLFGQVYNDRLKPDDPYEFVALLTQTDMAGMKRNRLLEELADQLRRRPDLADCLETGECRQKAPEFQKQVESFIEQFGDLSCSVTGGTHCEGATRPLVKILLAMAARQNKKPASGSKSNVRKLGENFLNSFSEERRGHALALLDLARASYRLRDDDNIHLGRIESRLVAAVKEGRRRIQSETTSGNAHDELKTVLKNLNLENQEPTGGGPPRPYRSDTVRSRQLTGQPAGPGVAKGKARVIRQHMDLEDFTHGEILVCDAVDPNMTYIVPLAAAVVERRGGMLIHGAIIAREYGLPCVTGIADATLLLQTGDLLTVDGYLGIVTVGSGEI
jgi:phosphohistidine swiveling domain-containing protein